MGLSRRSFLAGSAVALAAPRAFTAPGEAVVVEGPAFAANFRAVLPPSADIEAALSAIRAVVRQVDLSMSPYRPESTISRFNATDNTDWYPLEGDCLQVTALALDIARRTRGAYDPTVGGIVGRYGFGPIRRLGDGNHLDLSVRSGEVRKREATLTLDLCGLAKGFALDRITDGLAALDIRDFLVELGGEIRARGHHPAGRPWRAGIERPVRSARRIEVTLDLAGLALATSGDFINGYAYRDRQYGHIIDPRRRKPARGRLASVSVLAHDAANADGLATALFAMGIEEGAAFAGAEALPALFLVREGSRITHFMTGDFGSHIRA